MPSIGLSVPVLEALGAALLALVVLRMLIACVSSLQRARASGQIDQLAREELRLKIEERRLAVQVREEQHELSWNGYRKFEVERITRWENGRRDIASFYLVPHDGRRLPAFHPGQFLTLRLQLPGEVKAQVRCYSLSDCHDQRRYRLTIKRVPDGRVSGYFHEHVQEGDILDVRAPSGRFVLDMTEQFPVVFVAGGVGVTPLLCMFNSLAKEQPTREVWFFYAARSGEEFIMQEHFEALAADCSKARLAFCYSDPTDADLARFSAASPDQADRVTYEHVRISGDFLQQRLPSGARLSRHFFICGPPPMMNALDHELREWPVAAEQIHMELFGPKSVAAVKPTHAMAGLPAAVDAAPAKLPQITFKRSGKTMPWSREATSLLSFAQDHGVQIDAGCCAGDCHTCMTAVMSGEVTYLVEVPNAPDAGTCLPCVAIPKTDLVLDA
jgi:ferredoxin-NADP reductase